MNMKSAYSQNSNLSAAVRELQAQLKGIDASLVIYFASSAFEPEAVSTAVKDAFPGAITFGCSTAGEIVTGQMLSHSVVAMAFNEQAIKDVRVEVLEDLNSDSHSAFDSFERHFGVPMKEMDQERYVGIMLIDGLSGKEELIIDRIGDLTDINFIGGSAGDDLKFTATHVYANGKAYRNAAVLAILEPTKGFSFIKTQSFRSLDRKLEVTKANPFTREVVEFNGKPAAEAYAEALGVSPSEAPGRFMHNPVGLVIGDEPYVRSPQQIKGKTMVFYCSVVEGMELSVLESTDIIADTRKALDEARASGGISGIINFNCILRTLELGKKGQKDDYGALFSGIQTIGFSTYGEQYIGHINQTATMLVLR